MNSYVTLLEWETLREALLERGLIGKFTQEIEIRAKVGELCTMTRWDVLDRNDIDAFKKIEITEDKNAAEVK